MHKPLASLEVTAFMDVVLAQVLAGQPLVDTPITAAIQKPKMSSEAVVEATLRAIARGQDEILVGQVRLLPLLMRIAPRYAARPAAKS